VPTGPYVVLPLLGPSTLRDSLAVPVDSRGDVVAGMNDVAGRNALMTLRLVDLRATLLGAGKLLEAAALDKYSFTRDAYLQRRRGQVREEPGTSGAPSEERFDLPEPDKIPPAIQKPPP
jgi:phospholipid-binding lipoprotein MlaA